MLDRTSQIDANFYRLIHRIVGPQLSGQPAERRREIRRPFRSMQKIAPHCGPGFPHEDEFLEVRCCDLTRAGFSFLLPCQPEFRHLVAAFGRPPEQIHVAAEVLRCEPVLLSASGEIKRVADPGASPHAKGPQRDASTAMFLVACRFTQRLERPRGLR